MNDQRISLLAGRYFDRDATVAEMAELQVLLRNDAEARARFWEAAEWHALFRQWGEQEWGRKEAKAQSRVASIPSASRPSPRAMSRARPERDRKIVRFPLARWAAGIAALAAIVLLVFTFQSSAPVATIDRVNGAVWSSKALTPRTKLKPGRLELKSGAVVIAFHRGARVVVEGPADFEVRSDNSLELRSGRVRAHVPPSAHGFSLETPRFTAVDMGTEFGCDVALNGTGELHVFAGKVDLQPGGERTAGLKLSENQAMRIAGSLLTPIAARPLSFKGENDLILQELREKGDLLGSWRIASRQLDEHPATVFHLDFEKISGTLFPNRAQRASAQSGAKLVGGRPVEGRWPGKGAVAFQGAGDRLEFAVPGQFVSLTLLAWVRPESLHAGQNPLVMGRNEPGLGAVHWYLYGNGRLGVGVRSRMNDAAAEWNTFHSEPVVGQEHLRSWVFLTSVLDGATGTATHYFNGEPVGSRDGVVRVPLQLVGADIGNHAPGSQKPGEPPSHFNGAIDELALLTTALSSEDVARLYQNGKPERR